MQKITLFRWLTLVGYFGLMFFIFSWLLWIQPLPAHEISIKILLGVGPLMLPLRGLLHGRVYTHAWSMYLALFYFVIGVWYAGAPQDRLFGLVICAFSLLFFIGAMFYTRFRGRAEKLMNPPADQH